LAVVGEPAGDEDGDGGECGEDVVPRRLRGRSWRRSWLRKMAVRRVLPKAGAAQAVALKTKADQGIIQRKQRPQKSQSGAVS
jgi:hypothetical protein